MSIDVSKYSLFVGTHQNHTSKQEARFVDVQSVLHGQVSLAAVNQICVIHEAMNG